MITHGVPESHYGVGFHHGSILSDMGHMGMIDYYRLPLDTWHWYREKI